MSIRRSLVWMCALLAGCVGTAFSARGAVAINEIHYRPDVKTEPAGFVELHHDGAEALDLSGWRFTSGIEYVFPAGTRIPAEGYVVVAEDPTFFQTKFGVEALGPFAGSLASRGETLVLRDAQGQVVDEVDYQLGFPWPTVGAAPGYSIELLHPSLDNSLGGSWRAWTNAVVTNVVTTPEYAIEYVNWLAETNAWRYNDTGKDLGSGWRATGYDDSSWPTGNGVFAHAVAVLPWEQGTELAFTSPQQLTFYFRTRFHIDSWPEGFVGFQCSALLDDGAIFYLNGREVGRIGMPNRNVSANTQASRDVGTPKNIDYLYVSTNLLSLGDNQLAVELHQSSRSSPDAVFGLRADAVCLTITNVLTNYVVTNMAVHHGPTPGRRNAVFTTTPPPQVRQVAHLPQAPKSGETVRITAKITASTGVTGVALEYQCVDPGAYIERSDPEYETQWTTIPMRDDGLEGDAEANDEVYTAQVPADTQRHRRLVRYRLRATAGNGVEVLAPYVDDPQPNFAYFVYDGVPGWRGAIQPGSGDASLGKVVDFAPEAMNRIPVYQLISKKSSVEDATWFSRYSGTEYNWTGTLVYDGKVYDHIRYRSRGGVWRYAMVKNMWKFDFNPGHDFEPRDNYGRRYDVDWTKLNLGACIQQGDYGHRGEQGLFEAVGFKLFQLAGVSASDTHWIQLRIVDEAEEASATDQYTGDFWGLYLAVEQVDGRFLDRHGLLDGNLYKMEGGSGALNNQGPTAASDGSDLRQFMSSYGGSQPEDWWRAQFDLAGYYGFQGISQAIHNYDIGAGKNYFYYLDPATHRWSILPWDLDLTWADNMYDAGGQGADPFKNRVLPMTPFNLEYRNRIRELRDLLFNSEQTGQLIDEFAAVIHDPAGGPSITDADRAMWDYNPKMASNTYSTSQSKAGKGRFYQFSYEPSVPKDFTGAIQLMKDYVVERGQFLDTLSNDPDIPATPRVSAVDSAAFPVNRLVFNCSEFSGAAAGFAAQQWRLSEVSPATQPAFDRERPRQYEMVAVWVSGEQTTFAPTLRIPAGVAKVGHLYRVRARFKDSAGRWSHWSEPVEFTATEADGAALLAEQLRVSELMYHAPGGNEYDFVELHNLSTNYSLDLGGVKFTQGIDYTFPSGTTLGPTGYLVVVKSGDVAAFRAYYGLAETTALVGPYNGNLDNNGEAVALTSASGGTQLIRFSYSNGRGWPLSADGAGHSLVPRTSALADEPAGSLDYGDNWLASAYLKGSPGRGEIPSAPSVVLNEAMANTEYRDAQYPDHDSNDWLELYNRSDRPVSLAGWYLSDDPAQLKKWAIPAVEILPHDWLTFDEVTGFHQPLTQGFGLSEAGEQLYLSYLPGTAEDRVADAVRFKGQDPAYSWGRYPDGTGGWAELTPTRGAANAAPAPPVMISEIMYHPADGVGTNDATTAAYIKLRNRTGAPVAFAGTDGSWRLDGSVKFSFPSNFVLGAAGSVWVVGFAPTNAADLGAFLRFYGLSNQNLTLCGPYEGKLPNDTGRVALERPQLAAPTGASAAWVIVDEVIYADRDPWPTAADGGGMALQRRSNTGVGSDPANWQAASPSWESLPPVAPRLAIRLDQGAVLSIQASPGSRVQVQASANLIDWEVLTTLPLDSGAAEYRDPDGAGQAARFYRLRQE